MSKTENHTHLSDQELLHYFKASGNNIYLGILLERYSMLLFGVCMKYLKNEEAAKDAVQHVYAKAIVELQKYNVEFIKSWLYMIARNYCLMQLRNRHQVVDADVAAKNFSEDDDPLLTRQATADKNMLLELTGEGLMQLPEPQKKCVTLFYLSKKSYQQIADTTGFNLMQVKSNIQNGKRNIKLWVEKQLKRHA